MKSHHVLSDSEWARIQPLLPSSLGRRGHPFRDHRQVVEGIVFRLRVGMPWRELPAEFGPWQTVWKRYHRFCADGTLALILARLQPDCADAGGPGPDQRAARGGGPGAAACCGPNASETSPAGGFSHAV